MMKRLVALLLVAIMCLLLCACGKHNNTANDITSENITEGAVEENETGTINKVDEKEPDTTTEPETGSFESVNLGDKLSLEFAEITIDSVSYSQELKPTDTSGVYSYFPDKENEQYFYIVGTIKNIGGQGYSVENVVAEIVFDDKYTYNARIAADNGGNDFYGDYIEPFESVTYYLYASVPDELLNQYTTVTFNFGFKDSFSGSYYDDFEECDYLYQLIASK